MIGRAVVVGGALAWAAPALPCNERLPTLAEVGPADGLVVPTNASFLGAPMASNTNGSWWFQRVGTVMGTPLTPLAATFSPDFTRLTPPAELEPGTDYDVFFLADGAPPQPPSARSLGGFPSARFSTSAGPDTEPPAAPTASLAETRQLFVVCGAVAEGQTFLTFDVAVDDAGGAHGVRLERVQDSGARVVVDSRILAAGEDTTALFDQGGQASGVHDYLVTAIDFAGNESEPTVVSADLGCPGACASTSSAPLGALALALLALRRRRRRA